MGGGVNSSVEVAYFGTENYWSKFILNGNWCEAKFNFQMDTRCGSDAALRLQHSSKKNFFFSADIDKCSFETKVSS